MHGYRHSYQFGVVEDGSVGVRVEDEIAGGMFGRREAVRLILALLS